jgi:hypothetical protein
MQELVYKFFITLERQRILLCAALIALKFAEKWGINKYILSIENSFSCYLEVMDGNRFWVL